MQGRSSGDRAADTPGPGAYDAADGCGRGPAATLKGRLPEKDGGMQPGPGAYDLPEARGTGVTMGGRWADTTRDSGPGPGAYDLPVSSSPGVTLKGRHATQGTCCLSCYLSAGHGFAKHHGLPPTHCGRSLW